MRSFHTTTEPGPARLRWRRVAATLLLPVACLLLLPLTSFAAAVQPSIQRLILKDGSYQIVTQYQIVGNRVRFYSAERADWEEIPRDLVNWPATKKWNERHGAEPASPTAPNAEAAELDRQEQQQRTETPQVAPGLVLPDQKGIWALDTFDGNPELVQLIQDSGDVNQRTGHNVDRQSLDRQGALKKRIEMNGSRSKVQLHVSEPPLYVSLTVPNEPVGEDAFTVNTSTPSISSPSTVGYAPISPKSSSSPRSQYIIVRVFSNYRHGYRVVAPFHLPADGKIAATDDVIPTVKRILPGGNWMELTPSHPLRIGEYALMEVLGPRKINAAVWDFRIDPQGPDNQDALRPLKETLNTP